MKAMILAAGRGERLGALTMETPKPLIAVEGVGKSGVGKVGGSGTPLGWTLGELSACGIFAGRVINISHLGRADSRGDLSRWWGIMGLRCYIRSEESPLETAGGVRLALERGLSAMWDFRRLRW